jgi:hypothetical protein
MEWNGLDFIYTHALAYLPLRLWGGGGGGVEVSFNAKVVESIIPLFSTYLVTRYS